MEDRRASVAAIHDVVNRAGILGSQLAGHAGRMATAASVINIKNAFKVTVIVKGKTTITATVDSDSDDPNPANNTAAITVSVAAGSSSKKK